MRLAESRLLSAHRAGAGRCNRYRWNGWNVENARSCDIDLSVDRDKALDTRVRGISEEDIHPTKWPVVAESLAWTRTGT
jgi:hypothetical protein